MLQVLLLFLLILIAMRFVRMEPQTDKTSDSIIKNPKLSTHYVYLHTFNKKGEKMTLYWMNPSTYDQMQLGFYEPPDPDEKMTKSQRKKARIRHLANQQNYHLFRIVSIDDKYFLKTKTNLFINIQSDFFTTNINEYFKKSLPTNSLNIVESQKNHPYNLKINNIDFFVEISNVPIFKQVKKEKS